MSDTANANRKAGRPKGPPSKRPQSKGPQSKGPGQKTDNRKKSEKSAGKPSAADPAGIAARELAIAVVANVLDNHQSLDDALASAHEATKSDVDASDRGFARLLAMTALRRHGQLKAVVGAHLKKPLPTSGRRAELILLLGAAQLLFLGSPPHAVINTAVDLCRRRRGSQRFDKLVNAVLRRVSEAGSDALAGQDAATLNLPEWMMARWEAAYGADSAREIALASLHEASLDLTVRGSIESCSEQLDAIRLPTGSLRLRNQGRIEDLAGFKDGAWWVQDAAAALPAHLLGDISGRDVADLCAAPGGKTAQLAAAGARVTAVDISEDRLTRVRENLERLSLDAELITANAATWQPGRTFDAVLVDAPCTATGTIRRHPDILHLKRADDLEKLAALQSKVLANAAGLVRPGGLLVYCTCSLEPEEGEAQVTTFLDSHQDFARDPISAADVGGMDGFITEDGAVRTFPYQLPHEEPALAGIDGFYACRLRRAK